MYTNLYQNEILKEQKENAELPSLKLLHKANV